MFWIEIDNSNLGKNRLGFGRCPTLLLVDFVQAYTNPDSRLFASGLSRAVGEAAELLSFARASQIPTVHTKIQYTAADLAGCLWLKKSPSMNVMRVGSPLVEFCDSVAPLAGELVATRHFPSAFFATRLDKILREQGIDTIVIAGGTTSDSIRSTAIDGIQHGFHVIVVRECVGDRHLAIHETHLREIDQRYGDVVSKEAVFEAFRFSEKRR